MRQKFCDDEVASHIDIKFYSKLPEGKSYKFQVDLYIFYVENFQIATFQALLQCKSYRDILY